MTTPEPLRTGQGPTRASLRPSVLVVDSARLRVGAGAAGLVLPVVVAAVGLTLGAGSALWAADAPQTAALVDAALGPSSAPAETVDRTGLAEPGVRRT